MKNIRLIKTIYWCITLISILCVCVTVTRFSDIFSGLFYMWCCFAFIMLAYKWNRRPSSLGRYICSSNKKTPQFFLIVSVAIWLLVIVVAKFYTGQMPWNVIFNIKNGISNYSIYQKHFAEANIAIMGIKKFPYVFMNFFAQALFIYSYIHCLIVEKSGREFYGFLISISLAKLYFGLARGTNFEMFEVAFITIYCYWNSTKRKISLGNVIKIGIGILLCVVLFSMVISMRGVTDTYVKISGGIYTDQMKVIPRYFPMLSKIIALLSAYFAFGVYNISYYFNHFFMATIKNGICGIVPMGNLIIKEGIPNTSNTDFLHSVCWTPDIMQIISVFGIIVCPLIAFVMGRLLKMIDYVNKDDRKDDLLEMVKFYIVYELFSFPVGNFIGTSSSSKLMIIALTCVIFIKTYRTKELEN